MFRNGAKKKDLPSPPKRPTKQTTGRLSCRPRPQKGSFPLLDLEKKRCVILDEWDFDEHTIPLSTQLLWFEGKAFPIVRPQNKDYSGHLLYKGSAPIFITAKEKQVALIVRVAQAAYNAGHPSQESMLLRRLKLYWLSRKLPVQPGVQMHECGACFAKLICYHAGVALRWWLSLGTVHVRAVFVFRKGSATTW